MAERYELAFLKNALNALGSPDTTQPEAGALLNEVFKRLLAGNTQIAADGTVTSAGITTTTPNVTNASGTLPANHGGTGVATLAAHGVVVGEGTSAVAVVGPDAATGKPFVSQGAAADPAYADLGVAHGGTGLTSGTSGGVLGFTASGTLASSAALAANALVVGGGAGATPTTNANLTVASNILSGATQPRAKVWKSAGQTLTTGVTATLTWDSEDYDVGSLHDPVTNNSRMTCPTGGDGVYLAIVQVQFATNGTGLRGVFLQKNGVASTVASSQTLASATGAQTLMQAIGLVVLAATDYVEARAFQSSGGNLDVEGAAVTASWLEIVKLW